MQKNFFAAGAFFGAAAVMLGAFGAHGLRDQLSEDNMRAFHTGVEYQFYHALALLFTGLILQKIKSRLIHIAGNLFIAGILFFSGSLYVLSTATIIGLNDFTWLGIVTPIGGVCFIAGWLLLFFSFLKINQSGNEAQ